MKIISTVPSQTELLYDLGLEDQVVGITKFCVHPKSWFESKNRIGGTKTLNIERIKALKPDLIIANKEENTKEQIEELMQSFNVHLTDVASVEDSILMIRDIGRLTDTEMKANQISEEINKLLNQKIKIKSRRAAYLIWKDPYMTVGKDTYIHSMMSHLGFENVFSAKTRYPELSIEELKQLKPEFILLSSEPYPFKEKHKIEFMQHLPEAKVEIVDGEAFSWYGSRMLKKIEYLIQLRLSVMSY